MKEILLFTDGSVNVQTKVGFGASLAVTDIEQPLSNLRKEVKLKRFENTSSTKMELEILLWALRKIADEVTKVIVYTDSQNIIRLPMRRSRFEENNYSSKKNNRIRNYELYKEFYLVTDKLNCEFFKVYGHQQNHKKDQIHKIFTLVDRASRKALRDENKKMG